MAQRDQQTSVPVWDLAVRIFHWSLVVTVAVAWLTGGTGGRIHEVVGYTVAGLVAFRVIWGATGTRYARFASFVPSPSGLLEYLKAMAAGHPPRHVGHNPAGGAMIMALLALLAVVSATGWMMLTTTYFGVPWVEDLHMLAADLLLVAIALHLVGVIASSWMHSENLVWALLTGRKTAHVSASADYGSLSQQTYAADVRRGLALLAVMVLIGVAYGWITTSNRTSTTVPDAREISPTATPGPSNRPPKPPRFWSKSPDLAAQHLQGRD